MTIQQLPSCGAKRFRVVAEPECPKWQAVRRPENQPWCDVTIGERGQVLSYGGELWPSAWPSIFHVGPRTIYGQETRLTPAGLDLFSKIGGN